MARQHDGQELTVEQPHHAYASGTWSVAWTGVPPAAPDGCDFVKVAHTVAPGEREVAALRVTVRPHDGKFVIADAAVLKAD